jgi:hypothetical protein
MRTLGVIGFGILLTFATSGLSLAAEGGTAKSVTGNLRDGFCNTTMGAQGPSHKKCAITCAEKGIPVVMVEKEAIERMEDDNVTVTGKAYEKNDTNYLTVESIK